MTDHETLGGRIPKSERRVRFADSMGMELVSIFLTDLFVLASHTPYSYHEHRKPPSSRLSSTLQAIQYDHNHHHNNHSHHHTILKNHNHNQSHQSQSSHSSHNSNIKRREASDTNGNTNSTIVTSTSNTTTTKQQYLIASQNNINNNNNNNTHYATHYHTSSINNSHYVRPASKYHPHFHHQPPPASLAPINPIGAPFKPCPASAPPAASYTQPAGSLSPSSSSSSLSSTLPPSEFVCEFTQPVSLISFKERVKLKKVHLENCYINTTAGHVSLTCNIRVLNISYDKSVSVRYTTDDWATHTDSLASYKPGSCDGWSDQFTSTISIINKLQPGQRIIFAVRFASTGTIYWDNNGGLNYSVKSKSDKRD